ncbi:MAG TPA: sigma-70 family RNA polymerase sigma factor [Phycisphaerae bacterium]|nr:sigma-70 family RNA polymerase sigma factor [Phycisphaerae bacterium]
MSITNLLVAMVSRSNNEKVDSAQELGDRELVFRTREGHRAAFDELVRRYQRQATSIAYRLLTNRDDAMEITQDAFLRAYDRLDTLAQPEHFGSWFLRILSNLALNRRRSRALRKTMSLDAIYDEDDDSARQNYPDPHMPTPLEQVSSAEMRERLHREIDKLPDMQRQSLVLFSIEKVPQKQVAKILDCSVEVVKWNVFTARKKLREELGDVL